MSDPITEVSPRELVRRWYGVCTILVYEDFDAPALNPRGSKPFLNPALRGPARAVLMALASALIIAVEGHPLENFIPNSLATLTTFARQIADIKGKPATVEQLMTCLIFCLITREAKGPPSEVKPLPLDIATLEAILFKALSSNKN